MKSACSSLMLLLPTLVAAQECETVIALAKTTNVSVEDRESIEQHATIFCREYRGSHGSSDSGTFSVSYNFLAASLGMANASAELVASKYCTAGETSTVRNNVYRHYVEYISPNAYSAYEQCLRMSRQNMRFSVQTGSILPGEFSMLASFISSTGQTSAKVAYYPSSGVSCSWDGLEGAERILSSGSSALLQCKRADITKPSYVHVTRKDEGSGEEQLILPWKAYTPEGVPVDLVGTLSERMATLERRLYQGSADSDGVSVQSGTVSLRAVSTRPITDSSECPPDASSLRGELNGRVSFSQPFASVPAVSIGLSHLDARGSDAMDSLRLDVHVVAVDQSGFNYSFSTWCRTVVNGASAAWIAVGR
jgi:hypothetical protein